jgi:hypothetical protein
MIEVRDRVEFVTMNGTRRGVVKDIKDDKALVVYTTKKGKWDHGKWIDLDRLTKIAEGISW